MASEQYFPVDITQWYQLVLLWYLPRSVTPVYELAS